jgi:exonuclease III
MKETASSAVPAAPGQPHHRVTLATLNVNGLPAARQNARTRSLLAPYQARHRALCEALEASDIDVVNLQEVFTHQDQRLFERYLPSFTYSAFEKSLLGPKGALATFSRLPLEKVGYKSYFSATRQADRTELPRTALAKSALKGVLVSRLATAPLSIINTHPLANDDWDWRRTNRFHSLQQAQLGKLARTIVQESTVPGQQLVLGCDANVAKGSAPFNEFLTTSGLHDAFADDTEPTFYGAFLYDPKLAPCIDFILHTSGITISDQRRVPTTGPLNEDGTPIFLTDHQGLQATLSF